MKAYNSGKPPVDKSIEPSRGIENDRYAGIGPQPPPWLGVEWLPERGHNHYRGHILRRACNTFPDGGRIKDTIAQVDVHELGRQPSPESGLGTRHESPGRHQALALLFGQH